MIAVPTFERSALVTDDAALAAKVSALFAREGRYFPVMDGPRMLRPDASNEVTRRRNALVMTGSQCILMGGLPNSAVAAVRPGWQQCTVSDRYEEHVRALRGMIRPTKGVLRWGPENLGVGAYQARRARQELVVDLEQSPSIDLVKAGTHLLVACERGDSLAEVIASNLAFACNASLAMFPELEERERERWLEELYSLGDGGDVTGRFIELCQRAKHHLGDIDFSTYKTVLFVTAGFPWGIGVAGIASTHMYRYPDFGRSVIEGLWSCQKPQRTARTALLIDPQTVEGSEIPSIEQALQKNRTLTRVIMGRSATIARVQLLMDLLPHDIIVLSTHAGDAPGQQITYEYPDAEGRLRRLVVDEAVGIAYHPADDKYLVTEYHRFRYLDGIDWRDEEGKAALPVGTALTTWSAMSGTNDRDKFIIDTKPIPRVIGSMAMKLHDGIWLYASQGFAPESTPLIVNNSCWSWHELSQRTTFAGARGYLGSLFPITDVEAQEVGRALFGKYIGRELPRALWLAQRDVYGPSARRPYVLVGLPFVSIRPNATDSLTYLHDAYLNGISAWSNHAQRSARSEIRQNSKRYSDFLSQDFQSFKNAFKGRGKSPQ